MKILFTIAGLQPEHGGPSNSVPALAAALARSGVVVELVTCESSPAQGPPRLPPASLVATRLVSAANRKIRWHSAGNAFTHSLRAPTREGGYSAVHDHGLWLPNNHAVAVAARKLGLPLVVSPRGMLTAWSIQHKGWKKQFAWWLYQRRDLRSARLLHATSMDEAEGFRALGLTQPIAVIPNGVELPSPLSLDRGESDATLARPMGEGQGVRASGEVSNPSSPSQLRTALFLSRVHPKKGLLELVEAWARVRPAHWRMVIAGGDEGGHRAAVEAAISARGLESQFSFVGEVSDTERWAHYRSADLFVLPTKSENFGIVVAEALACGIPVITTKGAPWEELETHRCGWWVNLGVEPLVAALNSAVQASEETRREMGCRGRVLIEAKYSWTMAAQQMKASYAWILGNGDRPACIVGGHHIPNTSAA